MKRLVAWLLVSIAAGTASPAQARDITGEWAWGAGGGRAIVSADGTGADGRGNTLDAVYTLRGAPEANRRSSSRER
jgi:hypothetical protein